MTASMSVAGRCGITYRQLDHWIRRGYVQCDPTGYGFHRDLSAHEERVAALMGRLVAAGFTVEASARRAREMAEAEHADGHVNDSIIVHLDGRP